MEILSQISFLSFHQLNMFIQKHNTKFEDHVGGITSLCVFLCVHTCVPAGVCNAYGGQKTPSLSFFRNCAPFARGSVTSPCLHQVDVAS